ncbi:galactose-3-O-sulfotransferase 2-like [Branchiostoma floridae x Branchiostoma japonicum]
MPIDESLRKRDPSKVNLTDEGLSGVAIDDTLRRQPLANDVLAKGSTNDAVNNRWKSANDNLFKGSNDGTIDKTLIRRAAANDGLKITSKEGQERSKLGITSNTCSKKTNLVFLKTHKTASSTVQNIIMRFGSARNLTFALPSDRTSNLGFPGLFQKSYVLQEHIRKRNTSYNILCHHTRFNYTNIRDLMPDDTVYITIVRNPVDMYESIFYYMQFDKEFKVNSSNPLNTFLDKPFYYVSRLKKKPSNGLYRNPMFYDLGYLRTESVSEKTIRSDIYLLQKIFSVVMVADYFEESLILMKHTLCWDIDDVTFFKLNARREGSIRHVTADMAGKIRRWNKADVMLFDHFNRTLWSKLSRLPFDWRKEVAILKERNRRLQKDCIQSDRVWNTHIEDKRFEVWQPPGITIKGFRLKESARMNDTCVNMAKSELPFTSELQDKAAPTFWQRQSRRRNFPSISHLHNRLAHKPSYNNNSKYRDLIAMAKRNVPPIFETRDKQNQNLNPNRIRNFMAEKKSPSIIGIHGEENKKPNAVYPNQNAMAKRNLPPIPDVNAKEKQNHYPEKKLPPIFQTHDKEKQNINPKYSHQNAIVEKKLPPIHNMHDKENYQLHPKNSDQNFMAEKKLPHMF